ncbi:BtpA/SgcQ family protein, partial [Chamaesiphon sp. OTE_8_metabat_110]
NAVRETIDRGLADAIILSGAATGSPPSIEDLRLARAAAGTTPMLIGSGANFNNINSLMQYADGAIVSSSLKRQGKIENSIDPIRVSQFVETIRQDLASRSVQRAIDSMKIHK